MREQVIAVIKSGAVGVVVGFLIGMFRLPAPAPPTIAGVVGIAALALGAYLGGRL